jgi:hypothetical protein
MSGWSKYHKFNRINTSFHIFHENSKRVIDDLDIEKLGINIFGIIVSTDDRIMKNLILMAEGALFNYFMSVKALVDHQRAIVAEHLKGDALQSYNKSKSRFAERNPTLIQKIREYVAHYQNVPVDIKQDFLSNKIGFKLSDKNFLRWNSLSSDQRKHIEENEIYFHEIAAEYHSMAKKHHDNLMNLLERAESKDLNPFYEKTFSFKAENPKYHTHIPCKLSQFRGMFCL